jgi:hypothetical protein
MQAESRAQRDNRQCGTSHCWRWKHRLSTHDDFHLARPHPADGESRLDARSTDRGEGMAESGLSLIRPASSANPGPKIELGKPASSAKTLAAAFAAVNRHSSRPSPGDTTPSHSQDGARKESKRTLGSPTDDDRRQTTPVILPTWNLRV